MRTFFVAVALVAVTISAKADAKEWLVLPAYPDESHWKMVTDKSVPGAQLNEWIPVSQSTDQIHDIIAVTRVSDNAQLAPPVYLAGLFAHLRQKCEKARWSEPKPTTENGHPIAYAQFYCHNVAGLDVDMFVKAILGPSNTMYYIERDFRRPTNPNELPGTRMFPKGHEKEAKLNFDAMFMANAYVMKVHLCPASDGHADCSVAETPIGTALENQ